MLNARNRRDDIVICAGTNAFYVNLQYFRSISLTITTCSSCFHHSAGFYSLVILYTLWLQR